jgi:REP element-mobilizing transposase RayT
MNFSEERIYHIYNRSFDHKVLFESSRNYHFFINKMAQLKAYINILAYCIMPDHYHLMIHVPTGSEGLAAVGTVPSQTASSGQEASKRGAPATTASSGQVAPKGEAPATTASSGKVAPKGGATGPTASSGQVAPKGGATGPTASSGQVASESEGTGPTASSGLTGVGMQVIARKIGTIQSSYTQAINKAKNKTGSLFQPKAKAKELEGDHLFNCFYYIHQNPIKAKLVKKIEDWPYSSFNEYYNNQPEICNIVLGRKLIDLPIIPKLFHDQSYQPIIDLEEELIND